MGYILVLIIGGAVLVAVFAMLLSGQRRPSGRAAPGSDITPKKPAADEPTPAASSTARPGVASAAQKRTPPA